MKSGRKILVVDDEKPILDFYVEVLHRGGYEVECAQSGQEAVRKFRAERPKLVILDIGLGKGMTGFEVLSHIRAIDQQVSVIMLTAYGADDNFVRAGEMQADNFIVKPVTERGLLARVRMQWPQQRSIEPAAVLPRTEFRFQGWTYNAELGTVTLANGETHPLRGQSPKIMLLFLQDPDYFLSQQRLVEYFKIDPNGSVFFDWKAIRMPAYQAINRLRRRLLDITGQDCIERHRNHGYRLKGGIT